MNDRLALLRLLLLLESIDRLLHLVQAGEELALFHTGVAFVGLLD